MAIATGELLGGPPRVALPRAEMPARLKHITELTGERLRNTNWVEVGRKGVKYYWDSIRPNKDPAYLAGLFSGTILNVIGLNEPVVAGFRMASPFINAGFYGAKGLARFKSAEVEERFIGKGDKLRRYLGGIAATSIVGNAVQAINAAAEAVGNSIAQATPTAYAAELSSPAVSSIAAPADAADRIAASQAAKIAGIVAEPAIAPSSPPADIVLTSSVTSEGVNSGVQAASVDKLAAQLGDLPLVAPDVAPFDRATAEWPNETLTQQPIPADQMPNHLTSDSNWPVGKDDLYPTEVAAHAEAAFEKSISATVAHYMPTIEKVTNENFAAAGLTSAQVPQELYDKVRRDILSALEISATEKFVAKSGAIAEQAGLSVVRETANYGHHLQHSYVDLSQLPQDQYERVIKEAGQEVFDMMKDERNPIRSEMDNYAQQLIKPYLTDRDSILSQIRNIPPGAFTPRGEEFINDLFSRSLPQLNSREGEHIVATLAANYEQVYNFIGKNPNLVPAGFHLPAVYELDDLLAAARRGDSAALQQMSKLLELARNAKLPFREINDPQIELQIGNILKLR